jgi:leucyl aminopeptidase
MDFTATAINHLSTHIDCLIIGIFEQNELSALAQELDQQNQGAISAFLKQGDFSGKLEETALLYQPSGIPAHRLLLVGCGKKNDLTDQSYYKLLRAIARQLKQTKTQHAVYALPELAIKNHDLAWQLKQAVFNIRDELYSFTQLKSKAENSAVTLSNLNFYTPTGDLTVLNQALHVGLTLANNVKLTRDLANLPPNICTPTYLAEQAQKAAKEVPSLQVEVLEEAHMRELKMGAILAVTQGSQQPAKFVIIRYQGAAKKEAKPIVLIGKGITFDTGGLNLKASPNILGMKYDMCGAASILATLKTAAELKLPLNIVGIMVCVENMIGSHAYRPDDVITSMSGKTIEINNTDAEGRVILCDALTYCARFQPEVVIDTATLTGAIITALGKHATGLFSNNQALADTLVKAGYESGDRVWQLPLWEEYQSQLDSQVADMVNAATSGGNSITAACFLARFAKDYAWAHLDIAGTAFQIGSKAFATGRPVPLLVQYLLDRC